MKLKTPFLLLLFIAFSLSMQAQQKLVLDLGAARKYALEYNKNMKNADYATDKAQYALREAIANGLPQLNATMDYSNALGAIITIRFAEGMPASEIDIKPQSNFNLNLTQLLFSGNYIVGVQMAKMAKDMSALGKEKTELEVISSVTDGYYLVLIAKESKAILEQNVVNLKKLYDKTTALASVGMIEQTDLDQLFVQLNSLQSAFSSAERQLQMAQNMLRLQLGAGVDTELELTENLEQIMVKANEESMTLNTFKPEQNIDFRLMEFQELLTDKSVDMKKAAALPVLSGYYRYTYKLLKPDFDMTPANMIGLQLNIPIISSGMRTAQTQQARVDLKTIQNNKEILRDQLKIQEKQLLFNLATALDTYGNQKTNVDVSRRVYTSLKLKYEQGLISGLDLINADNNYLKAESEYINAMMQVMNSRLQLEKLYGNIHQ